MKVMFYTAPLKKILTGMLAIICCCLQGCSQKMEHEMMDGASRDGGSYKLKDSKRGEDLSVLDRVNAHGKAPDKVSAFFALPIERQESILKELIDRREETESDIWWIKSLTVPNIGNLAKVIRGEVNYFQTSDSMRAVEVNLLNLVNNNITRLDLKGAQLGDKKMHYDPQSENDKVYDKGYIEKICKKLEKLTNLEELNLSSNRLTSGNIEEIIRVFKYLPKITEVDFSGNALMAEEVKPLADSLPRTIKKLIFTKNNIGSNYKVGLSALMNKLSLSTLLTTLDLSHNYIPSQGCQLLADGLVNCKNLQVIKLSHNPLFYNESSNSGCNNFLDVFAKFSQLKELYLSGTCMDAAKMKCLVPNLKLLPQLEVLALSENELQVEGARALARALPCLPNLTFLNLHHVSMENEGFLSLYTHLKKLNKLKLLYLMENCLSETSQSLADSLSERWLPSCCVYAGD